MLLTASKPYHVVNEKNVGYHDEMLSINHNLPSRRFTGTNYYNIKNVCRLKKTR